MPIRQAYLNGLIPSEQRATVLSFDNLMGSAGGVVPAGAGPGGRRLGLPPSYLVAAAFQLLAVPFMVLARRENAASDEITAGKRRAGETETAGQ